MDFAIPAEIEHLCDNIREFMDEHIYPLERTHEPWKMETFNGMIGRRERIPSGTASHSTRRRRSLPTRAIFYAQMKHMSADSSPLGAAGLPAS
jgi:hypothetical protein